jgi:SAM-dependent methyltransferase
MRRVGDVWKRGDERIAEFDATALAYDRHRPRYPAALFDGLVAVDGLKAGDRVVEIGAGTGLATSDLIDRGFRVTAVEPSSSMAALLAAKVGKRAEVTVGRFEDVAIEGPVSSVVAFNSWHWVKPETGLERLVDLLEPGGLVCFVWTEVISWGEEPFAQRLVEVSGQPWHRRVREIVRSKDAVELDSRFTAVSPRSYRFERVLDAHGFVEVTKTYGGHFSDQAVTGVETLINDEFDGAVTKVEEATAYTYRRL